MIDKLPYQQDIEDTGDEPGTEAAESIAFWEKKQRELVTSVVDYNLGTLADLVQTKAVDLSPEYQRRFRWDPIRQSKLIESFLMNVPVPPIFLNEDKYGQYSVIDGKQRLNTIFEFLRGRLRLTGLEIFSDINDNTFDSLPSRLQTVIKTRPTLRAIIILRQSDEDVKFEVFQRLNTGGVQLNPQEIRNSTYTGPLNNAILDLSVNKQFHKLLGITNKDKSAIYQEMRDAELVLRYFTFRNTWQDFSGGMKRQMDEYMRNNSHMGESGLEELKNDFLNTVNVVEAAFGEHSFQRWMPEKRIWRRQVLASLYDAQMFACKDLSTERMNKDRILVTMKSLFENIEFRKFIDSATNTPGFFQARIKVIKGMLEKIIEGG